MKTPLTEYEKHLLDLLNAEIRRTNWESFILRWIIIPVIILILAFTTTAVVVVEFSH